MEHITKKSFHEILRAKADEFAFTAYKITKQFPRDEIHGITSQLRRASLSVVLNCIEGYARIGDKQHKNFLIISYGSLKESKYLIHFSFREKYMSEQDYKKLINLSEEIGAMLWKTIQGLKSKC